MLNSGFIAKSVSLVLLSSCLFANSDDSYTLDKSVVSASGFEQSVTDAPASISVVTKEELENKPFKDIGEMIADVPGVDVTMNKTGTYDYSIRGFGSAYTLVLIDGKRQSVANGFYDNGFGGSESGYIPPASMIEKVEVIRGPASTLYGSDAVGGIINIITKKNPNRPEASIELSTQLQQHEKLYGNAGGFNGYVATPLIDDVLSLSLRGKYYSKEESNLLWPQSPWTAGKGGRPDTQKAQNYQIASHSPGAFTTTGFGGRLNWTINEQNNIYLDLERYINDISVESTSGRAIKSERTIVKDNMVLNHDGDYKFGSTNTYFQYGRTYDRSDISSDIYVAESKAVIPFDLSSFGSIIGSFGARADYEVFNNSAGSANEAIKGKDLDQTTLALYGEGEYFITEDLIFTTGLRYIYSDLFDSEVTPRAYLVYRPYELVTLKGGVAKGYKTPAAKQLTNGIYSYSNTTATYGNPDLSPETSTNYEIGAEFVIPKYLKYGLTFFMTDFKDEITTDSYNNGIMLPNGKICSYADGCSYVVNHGKTRAKGIEFYFNTYSYEGFSLDGTYTYLDKRYKDGATNVYGNDRVENLAKHTAMLKLNYEIGKWKSYIRQKARLDTVSKSKGGGNRPLPFHTYKDFYTTDLGVSYKIDQKSSLSFVIINLFDQDYFKPVVTGYTKSGNPTGYANEYQDYTEGRAFWLSYKHNF